MIVPTGKSLHVKPLPEYSDYCVWISAGGYMGETLCEGEVVKSVRLTGVNMGFRKEAIADCPLSEAFRESRKGLLNEQFLAYCAKKKGYHTYQTRPPTAPLVWHIVHTDSLTRRPGFWSEFWIHYDRAAFYWRLKKLGASVSFWRYLVGLVPSMFCVNPQYCWELIVRNRSSLYRELNDMGVLSSDSRSLVDLARFAVKLTAARFSATLYALAIRA
ncbi:MAG: hypothetical protein QXR64_08475 [Pyrobaculum sp.]